MYRMNEIYVVPLNLPVECKGQVRPTPDGDYYIFINARYTYEQQLEIYNHEMTHILENHHYQEGREIADIELEAKSKAALIERIKEAETKGLPSAPTLLHTSIEPIYRSACMQEAENEVEDEEPALLSLWQEARSIGSAITAEQEEAWDREERYNDNFIWESRQAW